MKTLLTLSILLLLGCTSKATNIDPSFPNCQASTPPTLSGNLVNDNVLLVKAWQTQTDIVAKCKMQIDYYKLKGE